MPKSKRRDDDDVQVSKKRIESLLSAADQVADTQEVIKPTPAEKACISSFCTITLKCKEAEATAKAVLKDVKPRVKELRVNLLEALKSGHEDILQIPSNLRKEANARAIANGNPPLPAYIRLSKNTKDLTITNDVLQEAFANLTEEDVLHAEEEGSDALVSAVLSSVRRLVRSFTEQAKLVDSVPRGTRPADVEIASEELAREAIQLHEQSCFVLATERSKREAVASAKADIEVKAGEVEKFFTRANMTSQRVNLDNKPYNLCCRTTLVRPKVTFKLLEDFLQDGVKECILSGVQGSGKMTKKAVVAALNAKKADLLRIVNAKLGTLASTSKTVVHLQRVAVKDDAST